MEENSAENLNQNNICQEKEGFNFKSFIKLFINPKKFFLSGIDLGKTQYVLLGMWIVGISSAIGRIDTQIFKANSGKPILNEVLKYIIDSWYTFWPFVLIMAAVNAYLLWLIAGWWYNKRLQWSGVVDLDKKKGRLIYMYTALIFALPSVLLVFIQTFIYQSYRAAYNAQELFSSFILVFLFWSVIVSYKAVTSVFEVKKNMARLWFLILPSIYYIVVFGLAVVLTILTMINK